MPSANVPFPTPLTRQNPWYPGQIGVPGAWTDTGERMHCTGTIFYVDPNHPDANDRKDGTDPTSPLATVAMAITKCQAYRGDVIAVMANGNWVHGAMDDYATGVIENVTLNVAGVRLVGVFPSGSIGVPWQPATNGGTCITVTGMDCLIEGFVFWEGTMTGCDAISATWAGGAIRGDNLTVRHCVFSDTVDTAIQLEFIYYADIHHNYFQECDEYGVYTDPGGTASRYVQIHHNRFVDCVTAALSLSLLQSSDIYENHLYNATAAAGGASGNVFINTTGGTTNLVHHNTLSSLLPGPGNGDLNNTCTAAATDSWNQQFCMNGPSTTNPT